MFLQRNVASQTFTVPGTLRAVADGSAVTSGASIYLNGSGTAGGGTLTHWRSGAWRYSPTQAETNVPILEYVLEATGAVSVSGSIRTTNADPNNGTSLGLGNLDAAITSRLAPTVAGRTLDVSVGGEAGIDWANVGTPSSTVNLSGTTISPGQTVSSAGAISGVTFPTNFGVLSISGGGAVTVGTNNDKAGYSLTQAFPSNFAALSIDASGNVSLVPSQSPVVNTGTATAGAASTITLAVGASTTASTYNGLTVALISGTGAGQARTITGYTTGRVATVDRSWTTIPDATTVYAVLDRVGPRLDTSLAVTAGTVSDKTGYSLTQGFPANFSSLAITGGGAVTAGTVNDKTGYSLTQAFPANFNSLAIAVGGAVTAGTVSDKTGYALTAAYDPAKTAAQAGDAMNLTAAYDAAKTAASASVAAAIKAVTDELATALQSDGGTGFQFTALALANAPAGGGGGGGVAQTGDVFALINPLISAGAYTGAALVNVPKTGYSLVSAYDPAKTAAQAGDAMALTSGERDTLATTILHDTADMATPPSGSLAAKVNSAGAAGDPLSVDLATAGYTGTQAGAILYANLNAPVGECSTPSTPQTVDFDTPIPFRDETNNTAPTLGDAAFASFAVPFGRYTNYDDGTADLRFPDDSGVAFTFPAAPPVKAILDAAGLDGITLDGANLRQALAQIFAALCGQLSGAGTGTLTFKGGNNPSVTRITATTDSVGNRSNVLNNLAS